MAAPTPWPLQRLGGLVRLTSGQSPSGFRFGSSGVPYFKVEQLGRSAKYLDHTSTPYRAVSLPTVPDGSVLIAKRGAAISLNRVRFLLEPGFMDTNVMALTPSTELESEYLYYWLSHRGLWDIADVTSVPQINNKHINPLEIALPQVDEQRTISATLRDVDALIGSLQRLIAKKRTVKQGMMQELLSGRTRLPGFTGAWTSTVFGEIASPSRERTDPKRATGRVVELEHLSAGTGRLVGDADLAGSMSLKTRFLKGDVLFGKLRAYLRKYWLADRGGFASTEIWALRARPGVATGSFIRYVVEQDSFIEVASTAYGTHMPRSDWKVVSRYQLGLPGLEEQAAIGAVLQDADAEINALEHRLEAAAAIKQGMMQELLTGRTRLVPAGASV